MLLHLCFSLPAVSTPIGMLAADRPVGLYKAFRLVALIAARQKEAKAQVAETEAGATAEGAADPVDDKDDEQTAAATAPISQIEPGARTSDGPRLSATELRGLLAPVDAGLAAHAETIVDRHGGTVSFMELCASSWTSLKARFSSSTAPRKSLCKASGLSARMIL